MEQNDRLTISAKKVIDFALQAKKRLAVAVSGGKDSMCLLHFLLGHYDKSLLSVVHVEHGIRGEQSKADARFVKEYCEKNGVSFTMFQFDVPAMAKESGNSEESEARLLRKSVFEQIIAEKKADFIALAHHELDQAETVLMHVFRGSGISGLKGMSAFDGYIIRPFIGVYREEVDNYATINAVPYRQDCTNFDDKYNRNFVRNSVIPLISQRYDVTEGAIRLSENAREDDDFINSLLDLTKITKSQDDEVSLKIDALDNHYALASRYVITTLRHAGLEYDVEKKHVEAVLSLKSKKSGSEICLPHGYVASRDYGEITFYRRQENEFDQTEFSLGITAFGNGYISVTYADGIEKGSQVFDGDKIPDGAVIRYRREGDRFTPFGGGTKKLKEYLIDKKIAKRKRDKLPLVCDGDRVLIVCGVEISDHVKVDEKTVNLLKITYGEV